MGIKMPAAPFSMAVSTTATGLKIGSMEPPKLRPPMTASPPRHETSRFDLAAWTLAMVLERWSAFRPRAWKTAIDGGKSQHLDGSLQWGHASRAWKTGRSSMDRDASSSRFNGATPQGRGRRVQHAALPNLTDGFNGATPQGRGRRLPR